MPCGAKIKKKLEISLLHADAVRPTFPLASEGDGTSGPTGVKGVASHQNKQRMFTRKGGHRRVDQLHRTMIRRTYMQSASLLQSLQRGADDARREVITFPVTPLISVELFWPTQRRVAALQGEADSVEFALGNASRALRRWGSGPMCRDR
ncbi:hypothetical protein [Rhodovulum sulfidophilum]|uniref:Uncharacterized protein n=1 Tax=Rhodovulum sulfidophilum TaxID=35806 RepID=A0ABS1RW42_RHOSU|nr:hypothetical protein [Rhodovulum sulfidophilum]MBL3610308.1 hypothetical protein [Rhodovulum sulfidophilum]MCE8456376.1 hypothetical protein [Rhodovulum sulfidophilum]